MTDDRLSPGQRGFTLIELLVVIAIIGILSSVVLASLSSVRIKARDSKRVQEMKAIQNAVELYNANYDHYPITSGGQWSSFDSPAYKSTAIVSPNAVNLGTALAPYIPSTIADPLSLGGDSGYLYISDSSGSQYCILIWRTPEKMTNFATQFIPQNRCSLPINSNGDCANGGWHSIYIGTGTWSNGC